MGGSTSRRWLQLAPVLLVLALVMGTGRTAHAAECFADLRSCYIKAAGFGDWVWIWVAGLDCELDFTECFRVKLLGR